MPRGNMNIKDYSPMIEHGEIDKKENAILVQYALDIFNSKYPDLNSPVEVKQCIDDYFNNCISKGLRPGNLGMYACLGLDKRQIKDLLDGRQKSFNGRVVNPQCIPLIKKACEGIRSFREVLGSQGKLNPATLIFWQKNFDGLEDVQRVELDANAAPTAEKSPDEIAAMIEQDIPIDTAYTEA